MSTRRLKISSFVFLKFIFSFFSFASVAIDLNPFSQSASPVYQFLEDTGSTFSLMPKQGPWLFHVGIHPNSSPWASQKLFSENEVTLLKSYEQFDAGLSWDFSPLLNLGLRSSFWKMKATSNLSKNQDDELSQSALKNIEFKLNYIFLNTTRDSLSFSPSLSFLGENETPSASSAPAAQWGLHVVYENFFKDFQILTGLAYKHGNANRFQSETLDLDLDFRRTIRTSLGLYVPVTNYMGIGAEYMRDWLLPYEDGNHLDQFYGGLQWALFSSEWRFLAGYSQKNMASDFSASNEWSLGLKWSPRARVVNQNVSLNEIEETSSINMPQKKLNPRCQKFYVFGAGNKARLFFGANLARIQDLDMQKIKEKIAKPILKKINYIDFILIVGHSSSPGDDIYNLTLSKNRAHIFKNALIRFGIPENKIKTRGVGESQLLYLGNSAADHARNRRIEFIAFIKEEFTQQCL